MDLKINKKEKTKDIILGFKPLIKFKTQYISAEKEKVKNYNNYSECNRNSTRKIIKESKILNSKSNLKELFKYNDITNNNSKSHKIINSFNIFEIIITQLIHCCMCRNMKIKNIINDNANKIIYKKSDIITYIRNMILFDIINKIILSNDKNDIINFLCRPIISLNKNENFDYEDFYKRYKEENFHNLSKNIKIFGNKYDKTKEEKKYVLLLEEHLKEFI